jgi:transposase
MTKISTVAMGRIENFKDHKLTIGSDLGDRFSHYCILNEAGDFIGERNLPTTLKGIEEVFRRMRRSRVALKTGTHSPWVSRQLARLGHGVIVAHARDVRLIGDSSRKDDRFDARTLARLARIDPGLLAPVQHRSAKAQIHLTVIRARAGLVSARTALVNTSRGLTKSYGERLQKCSTQKMNREKAKGLSQELRDALDPLFGDSHRPSHGRSWPVHAISLGACSGGKFVVSRAGEAYDARI